MFKKIKIENSENGVTWLSLQDRESKNRFSKELIGELLEGLEHIQSEIEPKVCVIKGLKDVFCAGAEKQHLIELSEGKFSVRDFLLTEKLVQMQFPIIAACQGHAAGGGLAIAACSDIVIMANESRYGAVFMNMGFTPGMGCTLLLRDLFGPFVANEMIYTGKMYKGKELAGMGTNINAIFPRDMVIKRAEDIASRIAEKEKDALYLLKSTMSLHKRKLLEDARMQEDLMHKICFNSPKTKAIIEERYTG